MMDRILFRGTETVEIDGEPYYICGEIVATDIEDGVLLHAQIGRTWLERATVNKNPDPDA